MTDQIIELADITLAAHSTEADLIAASEHFQQTFLSRQDGFVRRDLVRRAEGKFMDIIVWHGRSHAEAVFERAQNAESAVAYFSHMKFDPENEDMGVEFCTLLASFQV